MICPILCVKDIPLSIAFYEKLGFQLQSTMAGPDDILVFAFISLGKDVTVGLSRSSDVPTTPHVEFMIYVPEGRQLDAYYNRARARGITIANELKTQYWGDRTFTVIDLDGYRVVMAQTEHEADQDRGAAVLRGLAQTRQA